MTWKAEKGRSKDKQETLFCKDLKSVRCAYRVYSRRIEKVTPSTFKKVHCMQFTRVTAPTACRLVAVERECLRTLLEGPQDKLNSVMYNWAQNH